MLSWREDDGEVTLAFTDRGDGRSEGPYAGLNLGSHVGDRLEDVRANRDAVARALGVTSVVYMNQVHGAEVAQVDQGSVDHPPTADAMVTTEADLALAVLVADCTPVLLKDERAGVVAVAHAGRPGMMAGVIPAVIGAMRDLGAREIEATVGPSVCGRCYEVPEQMRAEAASVSPAASAVTWIGTPAIDVAAGVVEQLHAGAVPVTWVPGCTRERDDLYSYRRDGVTGRTAGVIVRRHQ